MTYYNKVLHLRRLAAIDPDLVPKALADGIHSDSIRHATSFNHIETVHYLLSLIPKPYQYWSPATGKAPLLIAAQEGYTEILALMVPYMDKPASALTWQAAKGGHLSAVQYFVNHYRTTEHLADVLNNGIYGAMSRNRLDIIEYLIENNLRNQPFMHSCMCDMIDWNLVDVYRLLVDHGFDVTAHQLRIAVHAQSGDDTEMLELVLDAEEWDREVLKEMAIESYSRGSIVQDLLNSYIKSEST
ncbi:hypothetical protein HK097_006591 [Rhizophlyctis rosea]|uniref:Uncharacterized protein n=1 Tax=Rhizophlyctis rosea TaxID=64517 RepID=A0AAD5X531_9FUNG|nr:hypothetical protein HK097_006591 [Rhizophlyctis rosea]